jgi:hypothetical protein
MTVSAISGITIEGQPQELSSFLRSGVTYVVWYTPVAFATKRLSWKPHNGLDFTEVTPQLGQPFRGVSALYDPVTDHVVVVWDDGVAVNGSANGNLLIARFHPTTGVLISGPTVLCQGSQPKMSYRTTQGPEWMLYYRTAKNLGVYGRISDDGGLTWQSGYPLLTGQVNETTFVDVASYTQSHASVAQLGRESRQLVEAATLGRTRPLQCIVKHPSVANTFFVGEPSKFDNTTLIDNLRGALVLSTDNTKLYHLDGVQQGTSDGVGAVARVDVAGMVMTVGASAGPTGNGDDVNEYSLVPAAGSLNVDLPGTSYAVAMDVSSTHGYVAQYADNSGTGGQLVVVNLSSGATGTVFSGVTGVRAVAVANFLSPALIFVASTEAGVERLRVYQENGVTPTLLVNTKLTSRANALSVGVDSGNPTGALVYASLVDRLNVYKYVSSSAPVQLFDSLTLPGGGSFFQSKVASNGSVVVAAGTAGVVVLDSEGRIAAQRTLSGQVIQEWVRNTVYSAGALVRPRETHQFAKSKYYFRTAAGGTSGSAEPAWASTGSVSDNTATWTAVGLTDGVAVGVVLDEPAKRIYAVGVAGGVLGTDGRIWLVTANGLF